MASDLLSDIQTFLTETGMGSSYFGKAACGNSELVARLSKGGRVWPETEDLVRTFMRKNRAECIGSSDALNHAAPATSRHVNATPSALPAEGVRQ